MNLSDSSLPYQNDDCEIGYDSIMNIDFDEIHRYIHPYVVFMHDNMKKQGYDVPDKEMLLFMTDWIYDRLCLAFPQFCLMENQNYMNLVPSSRSYTASPIRNIIKFLLINETLRQLE